jgi:hypothetical protein
MKKRIPYGIGDFEIIRRENYYYIDKTRIIEELENHRYPFLGKATGTVRAAEQGRYIKRV